MLKHVRFDQISIRQAGRDKNKAGGSINLSSSERSSLDIQF